MKRFLIVTVVAILAITVSAHAADNAATTVTTSDPIMDGVVAVFLAVASALGGFALKYAKAHWAILNDARVNEALASFASRLASSIIAKAAQQMSDSATTVIPPRPITVTHPDVIAGADKMLNKYPGFTDHVGMNVDGAREMIVQETNKLLAPVHAAMLNPSVQPLTSATAGSL